MENYNQVFKQVRSICQHIGKINEHSTSLLFLLLSTDIVFNTLHISKHLIVQNPSSSYDRISTSLEIYHLVKIFWVIVLLALILKSTRSTGYVAWILVFTFFLIDDAFLLHQRIGDQLANSFRYQPRFSELAVLALVGMILLVILAWAYFHNSPTFRKISNDLLLFMVALLFFGIIVDIATAIKLRPGVMLVLDIVEDGGEMVVYSFIIWYVTLLVIHKGKPNHFLLDYLVKSRT